MNPIISGLTRIGNTIQNATSNTTATIARVWGHLFSIITGREEQILDIFRKETPIPSSTTATILQGKAEPFSLKSLPKTPAEIQKAKIQKTRADLALQKAKHKALEAKMSDLQSGVGNKHPIVIIQQRALVDAEIQRSNGEIQRLQSELDSAGIKKNNNEEVAAIQPDANEIERLAEEVEAAINAFNPIHEEVEAEINALNPIPVVHFVSKEITDFNNLKIKLATISKHHKLKLRDGELEVKERKLNVKNQNAIKHANILNPDAGDRGIDALHEVLDRLIKFTKGSSIETHELLDLIRSLENQEWTKAPLKDESARNKFTAIKNYLENKITYEDAFAAQEKLFYGYVNTGGAFTLKRVEELEEKMTEAKDNLDRSAYILNSLSRNVQH